MILTTLAADIVFEEYTPDHDGPGELARLVQSAEVHAWFSTTANGTGLVFSVLSTRQLEDKHLKEVQERLGCQLPLPAHEVYEYLQSEDPWKMIYRWVVRPA